MILDESKLVYEIGYLFSGLPIPQPEDLRNKLITNEKGYQWKTRDPKALGGLVIHQELGWNTIEEVAKYHTSEGNHLYADGLQSISYTWAIRRDGTLALCNDLKNRTWSQGDKNIPGDENSKYMAVMLEGNFKSSGYKSLGAGEPTSEQLISVLLLWEFCKKNWNWKKTDLYGHYHFGKPHCPGDTIKAVIEGVRNS